MNIFYEQGWRSNKKFTFVVIFLAICLVILSMLLSLMLARHQAISKETRRLQLITADALARMRSIRDQFNAVVQDFSQADASDTCSSLQLRKMQELEAAGIFLEAVAHMQGSIVECSSTPGLLDGMDLGVPTNVEEDGTRVWTGVGISDWKEHNFVVLERAGWAVLIVPPHIIEALGNPEVSIGIFGIRTHKLYTARGTISPELFARYEGEAPKSFIDDRRKVLVYIAPSQHKRSAVIASLPLSEVQDDTFDFAKIFLPLGTLLGVSLGGVLILVAKNLYSPRSAILNGLANDEFYLEYQPVINLIDHACMGAEALIRWKKPDGSMVPPDLFIPVAEANGLICRVTARVFALVARDMREILQQNPHVHIGINISAHDLYSGELPGLIGNLTRELQAENRQIIIEATERGFLNDPNSLHIIKEIRDTGVKIAIDDFGTGYSSLAYLTRFELDGLKIDKAFVDSVGTDAVTSHVAFHIIEMAKSLKLQMVAEGVEREEQARLLMEKGVIYGQGWLFSKSLSPADFKEYLKSHPRR